MADLNVMLLEHARTGLQAQLATAVTNGDTEAAQKAADELAKLSSATAPKAPPYGDVEIKAALEAKAEWFGTDPRKSGAAIRLGKDMNPKKFASAEAFADALIKAVDEEFKPAPKPGEGEGGEGEGDEGEGGEGESDEGEGGESEGDKNKTARPRRSDAPGENDTTGTRNRRTSGPWAKMSDAPAGIQKEINRTADKFAPKTKEGREKYIAKALEAQYAQYQRTKGKK